MTYNICDTCDKPMRDGDIPVPEQSDYSEEEDWINDEAMWAASVEAIAPVKYVGKSDDSGYFDCFVCDQVQCGNPHLYEGRDP
jgi:hypothetical protein